MAATPQPRFSHLPGDGAPDLRALLAGVRAGREVALSDLFRATSGRVLGLALRMLGDRHAAEEVVLDVFDRVWRSVDTFDADRGSPLVWLLGMTRNRCIDGLRRRAKTPDADDIASWATSLGHRDPGPDEWVLRDERAALVRAAAQALPRGQREAITAAYFGGLSQSEIAQTLDVPLGTVKSRIRKGLAGLRLALDPLENEES